MPTFDMVKTDRGVRGRTPEDHRAYNRFLKWRRRLGAGEFFTFSYDHERNLAHHKKFMALVSYIADNSDTFNNKEKALVAVKIAAGHCDFVPDPKGGGLVPIPKSISFKNMKQSAFDEFYNNAIQGVIDHILPHLNRAQLEDALEKVSKF